MEKRSLDKRCFPLKRGGGIEIDGELLEAQRSATESVRVCFQLPPELLSGLESKDECEATFQMGQTVQVLAAYVEANFGVPMTNQVPGFINA